ncbi:hypothetical protein D3C76_1707180 [compost metagenome]
MVLGDVIQMIGDTLANIEGLVLFQCMENRKYRRWISDKVLEFRTPRQTWPAALTGKSADMLVVALCPRHHMFHRLDWIMFNKRAYRELRAGIRCEEG